MDDEIFQLKHSVLEECRKGYITEEEAKERLDAVDAAHQACTPATLQRVSLILEAGIIIAEHPNKDVKIFAERVLTYLKGVI